jgi:ABC-type multidrug transport system fused ATPase/permease subunit
MIKKHFVETTVITIAHRLNTVIAYDKILVLEEGKIKDFGTPKEMLGNTSSYLYKLVSEQGNDYLQKM